MKVLAEDEVAELSGLIVAGGLEEYSSSDGKYKGHGVFLQQNPFEFARFLLTCRDREDPIERILEIGSGGGGSAYWMDRIINPIQLVIVDNNSHWRCGERRNTLESVVHTEIVGDSGDHEIQETVRRLGVDFDLVFIDGDHTYFNAKSDYAFARTVTAPGGWIAFHDIHCVPEVKRVWDEISGDKMEFVDPGGEQGRPFPWNVLGIGLLKGEEKRVFKGWGESFGGVE